MKGLKNYFVMNNNHMDESYDYKMAKIQIARFLQSFRHSERRYTNQINPTTPTFRIHISHTDLDGYGCNVVMECSDYAHSNLAYGQIPMYNDAIKHVNTDSLGAELFDVVAAELRKIAMIMQYTVHMLDNQRVNVQILITDIGGLTVDMLLDCIQTNANDRMIVSIVVIDHHRSAYLTPGAHHDCTVVAPDGSDNEAIAYYDDINVVGDVYHSNRMNCVYIYTCTKCSATLLLDQMLRYAHQVFAGIDGKADNNIVKSYDTLTMFSEAVSKYDTGKWGNWEIDSSDPINSFNNDIDIDVILNVFWRIMKDREHSDYSSMDTFVSTMTNVIRHNVLIPEHIMYDIFKYVCNLNQQYEEFSARVKRHCTNVAEGMIELYRDEDHVVNINLPNCVGDLFVIVDKKDDTEYNPHYPFGMFSRRFLEEMYSKFRYSNDVAGPLLVRVYIGDHKHVGLRSLDDTVDCYEIAKANGGGGHPRAAGFSIKHDIC